MSDKKSLSILSGLYGWIASYLSFGTEAPFPGNLAENVLGKILFGIEWDDENFGGNVCEEFWRFRIRRLGEKRYVGRGRR